MAQTIAGYPFVSMSGEIGGFADWVEDESRSGIDGHTFRTLGKRGHRFPLKTVSTHRTEQDAIKSANDYFKLHGNFVTIERNSESYPKTMILNVANTVQAIGGATDGNKYAVFTSWTMQRAGE